MRSFAASLAGAAPLVGAAALCFSLIAILGHGPPWAAFTPIVAPAESCDALATRLSEAYASNSTYPGGDNLESWMAENGALVSTCIPDRDPDAEPTCFDDGAVYSQMDHVSASWVANGQWLVFLFPVGKVLDPLRVKVRCVYPTDAETASREDAGCGPHRHDAHFGSQGAAKVSDEHKQAVIDFNEDLMRNITGRADVTWRDVNCSQMLQTRFIGKIFTTELFWHSPDPASLEACERMTLAAPGAFLDGSQAPVKSWYSYMNDKFEPILGHPVCVDDSPSCDDPLGACSPAGTGGRNAWEYVGACSWPPSRFAQSEAAKSALLERGTRGRENDSVLIWNEIILGIEANRSEAVLAAFWVNATTHLNLIQNVTLDEEEVNFRRAAARAHARALGTEHVLVVDPSTEALEARATFTCDDGER